MLMVSCMCVVCAAAGDTTQTAGGKGPAVKGVSAAAARNLMWLAWAHRVAAANPPASAAAAGADGAVAAAGSLKQAAVAGGSGVAAAAGGPAVAAAAAAAADEDFAGAAAALAAAVPVVVSLQDVEVEVLHAQVAPGELPVALNGAVVGLATSSSSSHSGLESGGLSQCIGLGLVRAVDGPRQELYVLTDLPEQQLQRVGLLQLGKLELPDRLLECRAFASPYQGLFCLSSTATGAGQIKSRNNLLRSSQLLR